MIKELIEKVEALQKEARDGMKRASGESDPYLYQYLVGKFHAFGKVAGILKKQKEPHYTKRNALFDKCVENCDPATMKRVSDEVDEMLEKEQKPAEIHIDNPNVQKFDPDVKVTTSDSSADGKELLYVSNKSYNIGYRDGVNSVKSAEWSEEDEKIITRLIGYFESFRIAGVATKWEGLDIQEVITLLKSLRNRVGKEFLQPHWKPSEEQMKALYSALNDAISLYSNKVSPLYEEISQKHFDALESLYNDLKKLM